jgi:hypothetical protein
VAICLLSHVFLITYCEQGNTDKLSAYFNHDTVETTVMSDYNSERVNAKKKITAPSICVKGVHFYYNCF